MPIPVSRIDDEPLIVFYVRSKEYPRDRIEDVSALSLLLNDQLTAADKIGKPKEVWTPEGWIERTSVYKHFETIVEWCRTAKMHDGSIWEPSKAKCARDLAKNNDLLIDVWPFQTVVDQWSDIRLLLLRKARKGTRGWFNSSWTTSYGEDDDWFVRAIRGECAYFPVEPWDYVQGPDGVIQGVPLETLWLCGPVFWRLSDEEMREFGDKPPDKLFVHALAKNPRVSSRKDASGTQGEGRPSIPESVRHAVWRRDGGRCVQCGSQERLEFDHMIPFSRGGSSTERNLQLLCEACNRSKRDLI